MRSCSLDLVWGLLVVAVTACKYSPATNDAARDTISPSLDRMQEAPIQPREGAVDQPGPFSCVNDWPTFPASTKQPPLAVKAPAELWRASVPSRNLIPQTAMSDTHLAVMTSNQIWILERQGGKLTGQLQDVECQSAGSGPVADRSGKFYFVTTKAVQITPDGTIGWYYDLGPNVSPSLETTTSSNLVLSPDGTLFFTATDGYLYALNATAGYDKERLRWKQQVGLNPTNKYALGIGGGVGDVLFVDGGARRIADGSPIGRPHVDGQVMYLSWALPEGIVAGYYEKVADVTVFRTHLLNTCGDLLWSFPKSGPEWWEFGVRDSLDRYVVSRGVFPKGYYYYYSGAGVALSGPKEVGVGLNTLGADGIMYGMRCEGGKGTSPVLTLVAYSPELEPVWSLALPGPCDPASLNLANDGVLYLSRPKNGSETEVIAVQTTSPGLAATARPMLYSYNNRRTGWLAPE